jgi:hypothetical protein
MRIYRGKRIDDDLVVTVEVLGSQGQTLSTYRLTADVSLRLRRLCPAGFNWGFEGVGPHQLALALMIDATNSIKFALRTYQQFAAEFVARWFDEWSITTHEITTWITRSNVLASSPAAPDAGARTDLADPCYTPTVAEALADPAGFIAGFAETQNVVCKAHDRNGKEVPRE